MGVFKFNLEDATMVAGNVINLFLYGVLTVQLYLYYMSFPQDPWLLKTIIYLIYSTETVCTILLTYDLGYVILLANNPYRDGADFKWAISFVVIPVGGGIVAFLIQATYAYRLGILSELKYISRCIVALIVTDLVVIIVLGPLMTLPGFLTETYKPAGEAGYGTGFLVWASVSLVTDTTIASIMIWSLTKNKILSKQLKSRVIRLVYLIIGTGALTAAINLVTIILIALGSDVFYGLAIVLSKVYANSMMVFLNDRVLSGHGWGGQVISLETVTGPLDSVHFTTAYGLADTAQERLTSEGCNNTRTSMLVSTGVKDASKQHSCPAHEDRNWF